MTVNGTTNRMYSQQLSQQCQAQFGTCTKKNGMIDKQAYYNMKNSSIYADYKQARAQENSAANLQSLANTAAMYSQSMGMNIDVNQLASMYDADGNGLLNAKELQNAEKGLNTMYMMQSQQLSMGSMQNFGMTGLQSASAGVSEGGGSSGGMDIGSAFGIFKNGIGELFGSGSSSSSAAASESAGNSGGNDWLSKAGSFIGGLFG